tara:strand:+ start:2547 stop:3554 length:1008 start_codon:yes stop_codon:yes gene_type:complete
MAGERGSTIDVPIPSSITAVAVSPAITPPANADSAPTKVSIALDQWYEAPFYLTDKERMEVMDGTIPMQASEAIRALANNVDSYIWGKYATVYGYAGVAGTTPFASNLSEFTNARKVLATQLAPMEPRFVVLDPDAEANAINLRAFQDASYGGGDGVIANGQIGRKLGSIWAMSQNVPTHTTTAAGTIVVNDASTAVGDSTITWDGGGTAPASGDLFTIAGSTTTYAVSSSTATVITMFPTLQAVAADNAALTFKATHVVNLAFHRDAFAFATRPLAANDEDRRLGSLVESAFDPESGLTLRLEVTRQHKQTRYSFDILYGAQLVRRELACRIAG